MTNLFLKLFKYLEFFIAFPQLNFFGKSYLMKSNWKAFFYVLRIIKKDLFEDLFLFLELKAFQIFLLLKVAVLIF
jgi:hypothetical protein